MIDRRAHLDVGTFDHSRMHAACRDRDNPTARVVGGGSKEAGGATEVRMRTAHKGFLFKEVDLGKRLSTMNEIGGRRASNACACPAREQRIGSPIRGGGSHTPAPTTPMRGTGPNGQMSPAQSTVADCFSVEATPRNNSKSIGAWTIVIRRTEKASPQRLILSGIFFFPFIN